MREIPPLLPLMAQGENTRGSIMEVDGGNGTMASCCPRHEG